MISYALVLIPFIFTYCRAIEDRALFRWVPAERWGMCILILRSDACEQLAASLASSCIALLLYE